MRLSVPGWKSPDNGSFVMKSRRGFTLIELLVVIAMLGVMFGMSTIYITGYLPKWRLQGAASDVVMRLSQARFAAVKENKAGMLQFVSAGNSTGSAVSVYVDENGDNAVDAGDTLKYTVIIPDSFTKAYITGIVDGGGTAITEIVIGADGTIKYINGGTSSGVMPITVTLTSTVTTTPANYTVTIERSGVAIVN